MNWIADLFGLTTVLFAEGRARTRKVRSGAATFWLKVLTISQEIPEKPWALFHFPFSEGRFCQLTKIFQQELKLGIELDSLYRTSECISALYSCSRTPLEQLYKTLPPRVGKKGSKPGSPNQCMSAEWFRKREKRWDGQSSVFPWEGSLFLPSMTVRRLEGTSQLQG